MGRAKIALTFPTGPMKDELAAALGKKVKKEKKDEEMEEEEDGEGKDAAICIELAIHLPYEPSGKRSTEADRDTGKAHGRSPSRLRNESRAK